MYAFHGLAVRVIHVKFQAGLLKNVMLLTTMNSLLLLLCCMRPLFSYSSHTKDYWNTFKVVRARKLRQILVEQVGVPAQKAKWIAALLPHETLSENSDQAECSKHFPLSLRSEPPKLPETLSIWRRHYVVFQMPRTPAFRGPCGEIFLRQFSETRPLLVASQGSFATLVLIRSPKEKEACLNAAMHQWRKKTGRSDWDGGRTLD